jgi:iron complex transport system substrate-binding protein
VSTPRPLFRPWLVLIALAAILFGACTGVAASPSPVPSPSASVAVVTAPPTPSPTPEPTPVPAFPANLTDDEGTAVAIPAEPQKIVSITPANTEILYAIGAGDRVVAADDTSDYPAPAAALPDVATYGSVDVEKIVSLGADLVIAGGLGLNPPEAITQLRSLGIPVLVVYAPSVEGVYKDIELIGAAVGNTDEATALTKKMRSEIDAISSAAAGAATAAGTKPRVFYDVGYTDATGQIYGPAEGSFVADIVGRTGVDVILADPVTYEIPLETLIERDPQIIIVGVNDFYSPTAEVISKRNGWSVLTAVKNGDIRPVNDTEITRPGPRLPNGLRNLVLAMYPDLELPPAT